ncbi:LytTR family DNA-binding domain-containing protein [Amylibacter sp. IMCC11727]|uniref:LytTR family DNA-binding domain-containing protein n=1 Tax=Amylibacter sp. IMCC11727 TaxID=3039851 RepID=UPI00244DA3B3|nr:LytTR family DNA-binding domain-containing protein [Amylibacter sp. IMCC11727]WGI20998.1 LytTR family DNA-binding domain-containing protein [Amylibacter sp. IMCC11727]
MNINVIFSGRDRIVLHALPAVMWLASCLYTVLIILNALPPMLSSNSPVSLKNIAVILMCFLLMYPVYRLGFMAITRRFPDAPIVKRVAGLSLICVVIGAICLVAAILIADIAGSPLSSADTKWYLLNLLVGMFLMPVFFFIIRGGSIVHDQLTNGGNGHAARMILRKLGPDAGQKLVRMQSADHYVEVHTERGAKLLLMRLSDATQILETFDGAQVHRSHWVNYAEIAGVVKRNRKIWLRMSDGAEVPVSRSYRPSLRAAGMI